MHGGDNPTREGFTLRTGFLKVSPVETSILGIKLKLINLGDTSVPTVAAHHSKTQSSLMVALEREQLDWMTKTGSWGGAVLSFRLFRKFVLYFAWS